MVNSGGPPAPPSDGGDRPAAAAKAGLTQARGAPPTRAPAAAPAAPGPALPDTAAAAGDAVCCSVPLDKVQAVLGAPRKLLCLYCERTFASPTLRQKHVERGHGARRGRRRRPPAAAAPACPHCDAAVAAAGDDPLDDLFRHLAADHPARYFGCVPCRERFSGAAALADHRAAAHPPSPPPPQVCLPAVPPEAADAPPVPPAKLTRSKLKTARADDPPTPQPPAAADPAAAAKTLAKKKIIVKSSKIALKRSKRLEAQAREKESQKKKRAKPPEKKAAGKAEHGGARAADNKTKSCVNPYPQFDSFYRVKKITDHSIDNLKISSLTFDDVFDKAFFNRIKCNIEENLSQHIDGKLFESEESESRISGFEKVVTAGGAGAEAPHAGNPESCGCEVSSVDAVAPITSISLNAQLGEDFEAQIEYGSKAGGKKKAQQTKKDEVHYKYFTRRKYQASILEHKENRDLSRLDMWTQLVIKERQQKMLDDKKSAKELQEYAACEEYKNKVKREELNRILDRRGPFEDLKEEATKKAAFEKLHSSPEAAQMFLEVRAVLEGVLAEVCADAGANATAESPPPPPPPPAPARPSVREHFDGERRVPAHLDLRRRSSLPAGGDVDRSDRITLICSSRETEDFELQSERAAADGALVELTGEWARCRMYVCAACGAKLPNMRHLLEHKSVYHQNVWAQHYEFVGNQSELYRHLSIPGLGKVGAVEGAAQCKAWRRSEARACTKCGKQCNALGELHRHVLECGGDWTWMLARKKCKYRPFGAKSRRKRRGLVNRVHHKQKPVNSEKKTYKKPFDGPRQRPSDADTIQRMLANLPAKRRRRTIISLQDAIYKSRKNKNNTRGNNTQSNRATNQSTDNTNNGRKAVRNLNKVLSSRILDTNSTLLVKRKLKNLRTCKNTQQDNINGEGREEKLVDIIKIPQIQRRTFSLNNRSPKNASKGESIENNTESKKRVSPRSNNMTNNKKLSVKKMLSSKMNIKNFFPVKKKKNKDSAANATTEENSTADRSTRSKATVNAEVPSENSNSKKTGFKNLVRSLSQRRKKIVSSEAPQIVANTEADDAQKNTIENCVQENKKSAKSTIKSKVKKMVVGSITNNNKQNKSSDDGAELSKKRKLQNSFRSVIDKVKKLKIDNTTYNKPVESTPYGTVKTDLKSQTNIFLEKENQEKEKVMGSKIVSPLRAGTLDKSLPVHTANNFSDTKENPPIPETIFNLDTSNEKSLQAKGELDFDKRQDDVFMSKLEVPMEKPLLSLSIETTSDKPRASPMVSPNLKGKIRKPNRGLNDCIAMLTNKLQQKDQEFTRIPAESPHLQFMASCSKIQQKSDYILRVPTFRVTSHTPSEETALDLSKKTSSVPELSSKSCPDLSIADLAIAFPLMNNSTKINSTINTVIGNVIENKCKEVLTEKLCSKWGSVDNVSRQMLNSKCLKKCTSVDETIEFVVNNYNSMQANNILQCPMKVPTKKWTVSSKKSAKKLSDSNEKMDELATNLPKTNAEGNLLKIIENNKGIIKNKTKDKKGESNVNLDEAFIKESVGTLASTKNATKNKKAARKVGQSRNRSKKSKTLEDISITHIFLSPVLVTTNPPPIETNLDNVLNIQEIAVIQPKELSTIILPAVENTNKDEVTLKEVDKLPNEDEPVLLENKVMELPEKLKLPSDSEDELPLASLIKVDEVNPYTKVNSKIKTNNEGIQKTSKSSRRKSLTNVNNIKVRNVPDLIEEKDDASLCMPMPEMNQGAIESTETEEISESIGLPSMEKPEESSENCDLTSEKPEPTPIIQEVEKSDVENVENYQIDSSTNDDTNKNCVTELQVDEPEVIETANTIGETVENENCAIEESYTANVVDDSQNDAKINEILSQISQEIGYVDKLSRDSYNSSNYEDENESPLKIRVTSRRSKKGQKRTSKIKNKNKANKRKISEPIISDVDVSVVNRVPELITEPSVDDVVDSPEKDILALTASIDEKTSEQLINNNHSVITPALESELTEIVLERLPKKKLQKSKKTLKSNTSPEILNGASHKRKSRAAKEKARSLIAKSEKIGDASAKPIIQPENDIIHTPKDVSNVLDMLQNTYVETNQDKIGFDEMPRLDKINGIRDNIDALHSENINKFDMVGTDEPKQIELAEIACGDIASTESQVFENINSVEPKSSNDEMLKEDARENGEQVLLEEFEVANDPKTSTEECVKNDENGTTEDNFLKDILAEEATQDSISSQDCISFDINDKSNPMYEKLYSTAVILSKIDTEQDIPFDSVKTDIKPGVIRSKSDKLIRKSRKAAQPKNKSKAQAKKRVSYPDTTVIDKPTIRDGYTRRLTRSKSLTALSDTKNSKESKKIDVLSNAQSISSIPDQFLPENHLQDKEISPNDLPNKNKNNIRSFKENDLVIGESVIKGDEPLLSNQTTKPSKQKKSSKVTRSNKSAISKNDGYDNTKSAEQSFENSDENSEIPVLQPFSIAKEILEETTVSKTDSSGDNSPPILTIEEGAIEEHDLSSKIFFSKPPRKTKKAKKRKRASENNKKTTINNINNISGCDTRIHDENTTQNQSIADNNLGILLGDNLKQDSENNVRTQEVPIKIVINKHRARRKSKSFRKTEKTDNDLFEDFSLVINKKTKRIPPTNIVDDSVCEEIVNLFSLTSDIPPQNNKIGKLESEGKCLDDSVEEMDMEIDDIPVNSNIIERSADEGISLESANALTQDSTGLDENSELKIEDSSEKPIELQTYSSELVTLNGKDLSAEDLKSVENLLQENFEETNESKSANEFEELPLESNVTEPNEECDEHTSLKVLEDGCQTILDEINVIKNNETQDETSKVVDEISATFEKPIVDRNDNDDSILNSKPSKGGRKSVKKASKHRKKSRNTKSRKAVCKPTEILNEDVIEDQIHVPEIINKIDKVNGSLEIAPIENKEEAHSDNFDIGIAKVTEEIADKVELVSVTAKEDASCHVLENLEKDNIEIPTTSELAKNLAEIPASFKPFVSEVLANSKTVFDRELGSVESPILIEESIGCVLESIVKGKHTICNANILPDIEPLSQILTSSDMDIAPVIDEIDKSLEIDDIYDFNEEFSYENTKKKTNKKSVNKNKVSVKPFEVFKNSEDDKMSESLNENIEILNSSAETLDAECTRKKSTRTAKAKALENIHEEALAELTENDQNRVCEIDNTELQVISKKKVPKKTKKKNQQLNVESTNITVNNNAEIVALAEVELSTCEKPEQTKENVIPEEPDSNKNEISNEIFQENGELRRSRRGSRKVTSYNENDLIDPLVDALESKRKSMKKEKPSEKPAPAAKEPEKKLNSEELFDLLKASTENDIYVTKPPQTSFLNDLEESSSTRDFNDDNFENVFENMLEKSTLLIQSSLLDKKKDVDKIYEFTESSPENTEILKEPDYKFKKHKTGKSDVEESITSNAESTCNSLVEINSISLPHTPELKYPSGDAKSKTDDSDRPNYCEICNKSFSRVENLIKHKRTLTHISKLSELEAKQAEEKAKIEKEHEPLQTEVLPDLAASNSLKTSDSLREEINITDILQKSEHTPIEPVQNVQSPTFANNQTLKLADIINDVLNKPVLNDLESDKANNFSDIIMQNNSNSESEFRRYKSLGERKSFEGEKPIIMVDNTPTTFAEKQISLLENIIEKQSGNLSQYIDDISSSSQDSRVSNEQEESSTLFNVSQIKPTISDDTFLKPTQYEEISDDSTNVRHYEDAKTRKTLNRDEELFIECCSLLKSSSEVSNYSKKSSRVKIADDRMRLCENEPEYMENKDLVQTPACEDAHEFSDNSRTPTPLGDTYDDNASDSNTISSNWNTKNDVETTRHQQSFTFEEVLHSGKNEDENEEEGEKKQLSKFDLVAKTVKKQFNVMSGILNRKREESNESNECHSVDKKIITKGARKVFEGLKVSIPTEELDLDEVLNCSPKMKGDSSKCNDGSPVFQEPDKPARSSRKSKPVKKAQVGGNILFKVSKKKSNSKSDSSNQQSQKDVYDFEETQDNIEVFAKPNYRAFRTQKTIESEVSNVEKDPKIQDSNNASENEEKMCNITDSLGKEKTPPENITKKKCMIMGRIFKNQAKNKVDEVDEEIRAIPEIDNNELVENYVLTCTQMSQNASNTSEEEKKQKLTEKDLDKLFDELLENTPKDKEPLIKSQPKNRTEPKLTDKKKPKLKNRKRARANSESSDDEFNLNKSNKKRTNRKNAKEEDNCINLEQELRECIGVASRKSQRKCTSGKQNVLVEYWSSDEEAFEALLESQKIQSKPPSRDASLEPVVEKPPPVAAEKPSKVEKVPKPKNAEKRPAKKKANVDKKQPTNVQSKPSENDGAPSNRRKRAAEPLYHWSSSSEDESQNLIEVKPIREEVDDDEDRPVQHGWIVGDSPKKLVTMLALTKGKKTDIDCVKEQKKRTSAGS